MQFSEMQNMGEPGPAPHWEIGSMKRSGYDQLQGGPLKRQMKANDRRVTHLEVPSGFVPHIVGRGGATIKQLCHASGADIQTGKHET
eukprot:3382023-Pyramimonas_sp.AAC.1